MNVPEQMAKLCLGLSPDKQEVVLDFVEFLNTARGPIVDEAALIQAPQAGTIAGAGLDVFDQEPLPPGHPLTLLDNTILVPHIGYVTREQYAVRYRETVENVAAYLKGEPIRVLNPQALEAASLRRARQ